MPRGGKSKKNLPSGNPPQGKNPSGGSGGGTGGGPSQSTPPYYIFKNPPQQQQQQPWWLQVLPTTTTPITPSTTPTSTSTSQPSQSTSPQQDEDDINNPYYAVNKLKETYNEVQNRLKNLTNTTGFSHWKSASDELSYQMDELKRKFGNDLSSIQVSVSGDPDTNRRREQIALMNYANELENFNAKLNEYKMKLGKELGTISALEKSVGSPVARELYGIDSPFVAVGSYGVPIYTTKTLPELPTLPEMKTPAYDDRKISAGASLAKPGGSVKTVGLMGLGYGGNVHNLTGGGRISPEYAVVLDRTEAANLVNQIGRNTLYGDGLKRSVEIFNRYDIANWVQKSSTSTKPSQAFLEQLRANGILNQQDYDLAERFFLKGTPLSTDDEIRQLGKISATILWYVGVGGKTPNGATIDGKIFSADKGFQNFLNNQFGRGQAISFDNIQGYIEGAASFLNPERGDRKYISITAVGNQPVLTLTSWDDAFNPKDPSSGTRAMATPSSKTTKITFDLNSPGDKQVAQSYMDSLRKISLAAMYCMMSSDIWDGVANRIINKQYVHPHEHNSIGYAAATFFAGALTAYIKEYDIDKSTQKWLLQVIDPLGHNP